jgi:predicted nucleic acid-binding protein
MPEEVVVCNTSPLLYLHQVQQIDLLARLYGKVLIPPAVQTELQAGGARGVSVPDLGRLSWLCIQPLRDATLLPVVVDLGAGEAEAIALALSYPGSLLILDDALGRRIARLNRIQYTGTLGILVKAKQKGFLPHVAPVLEALQKTNMWLSRELVDWVLRDSGEG